MFFKRSVEFSSDYRQIIGLLAIESEAFIATIFPSSIGRRAIHE
jgi:hypothetical protein